MFGENQSQRAEANSYVTRFACSSFTSLLCCALDLKSFEAVFQSSESFPKMPAKQRMRVANEKHSQNVTTRGNVPKSLVSRSLYHLSSCAIEINQPRSLLARNRKPLHFCLSFCSYSEATRGKISCWSYSSWIIHFRCLWVR